MLALVAALATLPAPAVAALEQRHAAVARGRERRLCEPYAETCRRRTIYTCTAEGRWQRGPVCTSRRGRRVVCEVEPGGTAVCVESSATPFPGDAR